MLAAAVAIVLLIFAVAAVIEVRDRRRHRVRSWAVIDAERHDLHADLASTQHRGIAIPIGDICRDRQRHR
ncbi:hypothetical protein [Jatrophihabitans fulvus]